MYDNDTFIAALEACELPPAEFDHAAHVRAGYVYLRRHGLAGTIERMGESLRRFAIANDKPDLYHETVTVAFIALINERLAASDADTWSDFAAANPGLFDKSVISRYYSSATLRSPQARRTFVLEPRPTAGDYDEAVFRTPAPSPAG
jgi:hypothetical protein